MKQAYQVSKTGKLELKQRGRSEAKTMNIKKPWSHQTHLQESIGKKVVVWFADEGAITGVLINVDNFTLMLRVVSEGKTFERVIFKSSIESYIVEEA